MTTPDRATRLAVLTICSNNRLPFARVLLDSARRHHPEADLVVGLADRVIAQDGPYAPDWHVVEAEALGIPAFPNLAFRYGRMALNRALKPFMLLHLLRDRGYDAVLYFDADIEIFRPLTDVTSALLAGASFLLTPHFCQPAEEVEEPNDLTIMRRGVFNLGFLGVSRSDEAISLLGWWARRLRHECVEATHRGLFVDQKFVDLIPGFAERAVVSRDGTLNVGYWNLPQRSLARTPDGWTVDGAPLGFFHFSGFDPRRPGRLSTHDTRHAASMPPALGSLTAHYASRLLACGYGADAVPEYAFGRFRSGTAIHRTVREMFRDRHAYWDDDPFASYEDYLSLPWAGGVGRADGHLVTNYQAFLHAALPSLRDSLDLAQPGHADRLVAWFVNDAAHEQGIDLRLIQPEALRLGTARPTVATVPARAPSGATDVAVIGYLRTASGVGEIGRQTLRTLASGGVAVEGVDVSLGVSASRNDRSCEDVLVETTDAPVQVLKINADQLPDVIRHVGPRLRPDAYRISIPSWELGQFPAEWLPAFGLVHEVWAHSRFIQGTLAGRIDRPVLYMPAAVEIGVVHEVPRARFGLPDGRFLFFFAFDFLSFIERKNPSTAIAAFRLAFPSGGGAVLVLKHHNGHLVPEKRDALIAAVGGDPDIVLIDESLSRGDILALTASCDAVLSLHRCEGFGLLVAEAMLLGRPVIATGYSATVEFLTEDTGYPVDHRLVRVKSGEYPLSTGQLWAEVDVAHAAWLMRRVVADPADAARRSERGRAFIQAQHGRARVAELQKRRLRELGLRP